jgi:uncharacterized protein YbjT (DUF2867 family)
MVKIGVIGATGWQGGALIESLLAVKTQFPIEIVAYSRSPDSKSCQMLHQKFAKAKQNPACRVAEVTFRKLDLTAFSVSELAAAFHGVERLFLVTQFWNTPKPADKGGSGTLGSVNLSPEAELEQGKNCILAAEKAGVKHICASVMENTMDEKRYPGSKSVRKHSARWRTPHMDAKGQIGELLAAHPTIGASIMNTSFYMENFLGLTKPIVYPGMPERFFLGFPLKSSSVLPMQSVRDIGHAAAALLLHPQQPNKLDPRVLSVREVHVTGENVTYGNVAKLLGAGIERKVDHYFIPAGAFALFPFEGARDLGIMFEYKRCVPSYVEARSVEAMQQLFSSVDGLPSSPLSFEEWLTENKETLTLEPRGLHLSTLWASFLRLKLTGKRD